MTAEPPEAAYVTRARSDVVRGSLWSVTNSLIALPIGLLASVLIARSLGPHGLGRFATYGAVYAIVLTVTNLGWSEATVQWLAAATARDEASERTELIRRCAGFHVFVSGPAAGMCAFVLLRPTGVAVAVFGLLSVWLTHILGTSTVIMTASARNATSAQIALITGSAAQVGLVTAALASHAAGVTWAAQLAFVTLAPLVAALRLEESERRALFRPRLSLHVPRGFWTYASSACVGGLVSALVFGRSEIFALRANGLLGTAGVFTIVTGLASQLTGPLDSVLAPLTPISAGLVAIDRARAIRVFERALRVSAIIGTFAACVLLPVGVVSIRPVYGSAYASAAPGFAVLGLVSSLQTVLGPLTAFAFATRSAVQVLRINIVCLAADAGLAFSLVPVIGLWGAVIANAAAQIVSLLWMTKLVSRKLGIPVGQIARDLRLFAIGLMFGAAEALICLPLRGFGRLAVIAVIGVAIIALRTLLTRRPQLQLADDDVALLARGSSSPIMRLVLVGLRKAGLSRSASTPADGEA